MDLKAVTFAIAVVLATSGCLSEEPLDLHMRTISASTADHVWLIHWAWSKPNESLVYVVIEGASDHANIGGRVTTTVTSRGRASARLRKPNGDVVILPNENQIHEIIESDYRTTNIDIAKEEFEDFLESSPNAYTVDNLRAYLTGEGKGRIP